MDTYVWMAILLGVNWGGFIYLLWRTSKKVAARAKFEAENKNKNPEESKK